MGNAFVLSGLDMDDLDSRPNFLIFEKRAFTRASV